MALYNESLDISFVKLIVVGERGTGKTSLIRTMKEDQFRETWDEQEEDLVRKILYWDEKVSLQMGELQLEDTVDIPEWAEGPKAILLVYDKDDHYTVETVKNKWYSLVNRHYAHVPLFLIRTKADVVRPETAEVGNRLKQELHAVGFFDCSARQNRGVLEAFTEIVKYHKSQEKKKTVAFDNDPANAPSSVGCLWGMVSNSRPLIKQAFSNLREVVRNPLAFTDQKRSIQAYVPLLDFGLPDKKQGKEDDGKTEEEHE